MAIESEIVPILVAFLHLWPPGIASQMLIHPAV